nr:ribonuclease H-like domain-containing protein [Tanacetum cinerariifolium]
MQNFISSSDLLCWNMVLKGNSAKSMTTDNDGNLKIYPPVTSEEHQQVQREEKARTILLSALLDEHMGDFYHMIDARDTWNDIKARFGGNAESKKMQKSLLKQKFEEFKISEEEGLDKGYDKMQKILTQMNTLKIKPHPKDVNMKFLRGLPPYWSGIALILKTKRGLEYISFDDLYNKLKFLEIDTKGNSLSSSTLSNAAFVSTVGSSQGNLSYQESGNGGYTTSPSSLSSKGSSKSNCSVVDDVIYSFFANHEIHQHLVYEDLDQMNKEDFKEYDLKHQMAMLSIKQMGHFLRECRAQSGQNSNNYQKYKSKEAGKDGSDSKAMVVVDGSIDWDKQTEGGNTEPRSLENFGMIAGIKIESDAYSKGEVVSADDAIPVGVFVSAGTVVAAVVSPQSETEFALMGLSTKAKWNNSGRNLYKLIDSSMSVRTKRGLGLDKYTGEGELGIDDSKVSIFHTNSDDLEGPPIYNRFASVDHMKTVPPPLTGNYMPPSDIPDIDESQMVYGKKATDSSEIKTNDDSISNSNDSVLFDFSDRSSEPSTNDLQMLEKEKDKGIVDSGCSRSMSGKHDKLEDFKDFDGGEVTFGGSTRMEFRRKSRISKQKIEETMNLKFLKNKPFVAGTGQAWMFDIDYLIDSLNYSRFSSTNLTAGSQGATPSNAGSQEDDSDSDDEPDVLIIHSTPTPVVPVVDEATTQNDGKEEANQLGLAFPSLNLILGVGSTPIGSTPIGSSVSVGSTPHVSAGITPPISSCASPISADRHSISAGKPVSAGKPNGSAGRPVSAGRPSGSAARTPVPAGCILGKLTSNASSKQFPRASSVENLDIHDGLKIFDCPKSGIFTSSSYDEDFSGPDANNLENSLNVSSTITKRIHNIHPTSQVLGDINSPVQTISHVKHKGSSESAFISYIHDQRRNNHTDFQLCMFSCFLSQEEPTTVAQALADPDWVEAMQAKIQQFRNQKVWVLVTLPDGK